MVEDRMSEDVPALVAALRVKRKDLGSWRSSRRICADREEVDALSRSNGNPPLTESRERAPTCRRVRPPKVVVADPTVLGVWV